MSLAGSARHVAVLVETSNAYARRLVVGIQKYASGADWSLYTAEHSRREADFSWLRGWRGEGILARIESPEAAGFVRAMGLPTVDLSAGRFAPELPGVETDDRAIATMAAEHFAERGLRDLAFVGDPGFAWSVNRAAAFQQAAASLGCQVRSMFQMESPWTEDRTRLSDWLRDLPKPVGVFACYDIAGQEVLEACKAAGLHAPDEVAVLGVDNDAFINNLTSPPLSSIEPDAVRTGFLAAEMLDRLMDGEQVPGGQRLMPPIRLVTRHSSDTLAVPDPLVAGAAQFIRDNSTRSVSVPEVLRHVCLSRRALDPRFGQALGRTFSGEIIRARMSRVEELLSSTDLTLQQIAVRLGYPHSEYLGFAFKRHTGKPPGAFRKSVRGQVDR
jgi:LacI family transcriptional regulator